MNLFQHKIDGQSFKNFIKILKCLFFYGWREYPYFRIED